MRFVSSIDSVKIALYCIQVASINSTTSSKGISTSIRTLTQRLRTVWLHLSRSDLPAILTSSQQRRKVSATITDSTLPKSAVFRILKSRSRPATSMHTTLSSRDRRIRAEARVLTITGDATSPWQKLLRTSSPLTCTSSARYPVMKKQPCRVRRSIEIAARWTQAWLETNSLYVMNWTKAFQVMSITVKVAPWATPR